MIKYLLLWIVGLCSAAGCASGEPVSEENLDTPLWGHDLVVKEKADMLKALSTDLHAEDVRVRMDAIRRLGAMTVSESKWILLDRFRGMPPPPASSSSRQVEKIAILREVLPKLQVAERDLLLSETFRNELTEMKRAQQVGRGKYYPKDLTFFSLASLEEAGLSRDFRDELARLAYEPSIPQSTREEMLTSVHRYDLSAKGILSPEERARFAMERIIIRPTAPIPWDIYTNVQQRMAYAKSRTFQETQEVTARWLKSSEAVQTASYEKLLHSLALPAVEELVAVLDQGDFSAEKRDYIAVLATDILLKLEANDGLPSDRLDFLVGVLGRYIEGMKDAGAFSRRAVAEANLNALCKQADMKKNSSIGGSGQKQ